MPVYTKHILSGSVGGNPIAISATSTPGTILHSEPTGIGIIDEVWLYAVNNTANDRTLTVEWGATGSANEVSSIVVANSGLVLVMPGFLNLNDAAYLTGDVSVLANATTVIGYGTAFLSEIVPGNYIQVGDFAQQVFAVSNDRELVLTSPWLGDTLANAMASKLSLRPIRAYASIANAINVVGFVNRITQ